MPKSVKARITPDVLRWARTNAGVTPEDAAQRAAVKPERLAAWESGAEQPTIAKLRLLASLYKRPLAVFFLAKPPTDFAALKDYRRLPGKVAGVLPPALRFAIRRARERRELALVLHREVAGDPPAFTLQTTMQSDPEDVGNRLRKFLGVTMEDQSTWGPEYGAFNRWRAALEDHGVLVFQARDIDTETMRGFSISEMPLPAIVLNIKDRPNGRTFTMLHELAHVVLRHGGVCDLDENPNHPPEERRVEIYCNHVAGAALVPRADLLAQPDVANHVGATWDDQPIQRLAIRYGVSREVILRRLLIVGKASEAFYRRKRDELQERLPAPSGGFAPPHVLALAQAGRLFTRLVLANYHRDRVTATDVADYLAVRLTQLGKIETEVARGGGLA
jgi:Zn-dependent peptidase ImmA (M78 family)/transcriptional regulator with XRE-family HTH domain